MGKAATRSTNPAILSKTATKAVTKLSDKEALKLTPKAAKKPRAKVGAKLSEQTPKEPESPVQRGFFIAENEWARMPEKLRTAVGPYLFGADNQRTPVEEGLKKRLSQKTPKPKIYEGMGKEEAQRQFDLLPEHKKEFVRGMQEVFAFERGEIELQSLDELLAEMKAENEQEEKEASGKN